MRSMLGEVVLWIRSWLDGFRALFCGSQDGLQRVAMKQMLDDWERRKPGVRQVMAKALTTIRPSHLHDMSLFDFAGLAPGARDQGPPHGEGRRVPRLPRLHRA